MGMGKIVDKKTGSNEQRSCDVPVPSPYIPGLVFATTRYSFIIHDDHKHLFLDIYRKENLRSSPDRSRSDRTPNVSLGSPSVLTPRTQRRRLRLQCRNQGCNVFFMTSRTRDRHESSASCLFRDSAALQVFYKTL